MEDLLDIRQRLKKLNKNLKDQQSTLEKSDAKTIVGKMIQDKLKSGEYVTRKGTRTNAEGVVEEITIVEKSTHSPAYMKMKSAFDAGLTAVLESVYVSDKGEILYSGTEVENSWLQFISKYENNG
jgi:hypothetical protein